MFTYTEARKYIHTAQKVRDKPGLLRISSLLQDLGNPQDSCKHVHIAGTNGKGSTTAIISSVLKTAGYRTGMYISPYVEEFEERISVDGVNISKGVVTRLAYEVYQAALRCAANGTPLPSEFEIITAIAFLYYREQECDIVVLETGLGGRFDATNVILSPEVAVITSISLDHTKTLGTDVCSIFKEKWGIVKGGTAVLYPRQEGEVFDTALALSKEQNVELVTPDLTKLAILSDTLDGICFRYKDVSYSMALVGEHQVYNAITALEAIYVLIERGLNIQPSHILRGLAIARFMGRFEVLGKAPLLVLDGAHNENGMKILQKTALRLLRSRGGRLICVMGMLSDKNYADSIPKIASICDIFIACDPDNPRALQASEMVKHASACPIIYEEEGITNALNLARALADPEDSILICGSLYLIGDARKLVFGRPIVPFTYAD